MSDTLLVKLTSGAYANFLVVNPALFPNWASYQGVYEEYRILGISVDVRGIRAFVDSGGNPGPWAPLLRGYFDEDDANNPTAASAKQHRGWLISADPRSPHSRVTAEWRAEDVIDLAYTSTATTTTTPVRFKMYCSPTDFGSSASDNVSTWFVQATVHIEFRGVGGP